MKKIINGICIVLGFLSLGLGLVGVVLPVLPTTPFLLLSAALFAKGSEKFHGWFVNTKIYKKYVDQLITKKGMTKKTKRNVLVTVTLLMTIGIIMSPIYAKVIIAIVMILHYYFFLFRINTIEEPIDELES